MWEGKLTQCEEKILLIKLPAENKEKCTAYIKKNHPYTTPELLWIAPADVDATYLAWVKSLVQQGKK
jgi:uncharacterized protein involved in tolerance to divalent cations